MVMSPHVIGLRQGQPPHNQVSTGGTALTYWVVLQQQHDLSTCRDLLGVGEEEEKTSQQRGAEVWINLTMGGGRLGVNGGVECILNESLQQYVQTSKHFLFHCLS